LAYCYLGLGKRENRRLTETVGRGTLTATAALGELQVVAVYNGFALVSVLFVATGVRMRMHQTAYAI
jgi:hypothetical protein